MRLSKTFRLGFLCAALVASLTGCIISTPTTSASRPIAVVEDAVAQIPGTGFEASRGSDGTTAYINSTLSVTGDFSGDRAALVDYALAQLASQDELERGRFVRFGFEGPGQSLETTRTLLASLDIDSEQYAGGSSLELANAALERRYVPWPAPVPSVPPSLLGTD